jgi:hypothetical protein
MNKVFVVNKTTVIFISSLLLCACSSRYASNGENQYMNSKNGPNLVIPKPLASDRISHFYDLPQQTQPAIVNIAPPTV